jgi:hypothetical protein
MNIREYEVDLPGGGTLRGDCRSNFDVAGHQLNRNSGIFRVPGINEKNVNKSDRGQSSSGNGNRSTPLSPQTRYQIYKKMQGQEGEEVSHHLSNDVQKYYLINKEMSDLKS